MKHLRNQNGQFAMEAVLLIFVLTTTLFLGLNILRDNNYVQSLIRGPWDSLAGVIENGVLVKPSQSTGSSVIESARQQHPNHLHRQATFIGDGH